MSEDKQPSNHTTAWIVTLIALPVLYVLSWGPVLGMWNNGTIPQATFLWVYKFYKPVIWLYDKSPRWMSLDAYGDWWIDVLHKPIIPAVPE